MTQLEKLNALIRTAENARSAAASEDLFASKQGRSLILAMHDLVEVDALFDTVLADVEVEIERAESLAA